MIPLGARMGMKAKTAQTVVVAPYQYPIVAELLSRVVRATPPGEKIFRSLWSSTSAF